VPTLPDPVGYLERELDWSPEWTGQARNLYERKLPPLATVRTLAFLFGVSPTLIIHMTSNPRHYYRTFRIPRKNRPARRIDAPRVALKVIQRWIHDHILPQMPIHEASTAYARTGGIFVNGARHVGSANLLRMDVRDFFPSIRPAVVSAAFLDLGFDAAVADQLTKLVTYREGLPQGAPTSPVLSNAVMFPTDVALTALADSWGAVYTRYADDIAFSSSTYRFSGVDIEAVTSVIQEAGLTVNEQKTRIIGGGFRHVVAGLSVSTRPMAPRSKRRAWRALFHNVRVSPGEYASRLNELNGIVGFVGQYSPALAQEYRDILTSAANSPDTHR